MKKIKILLTSTFILLLCTFTVDTTNLSIDSNKAYADSFKCCPEEGSICVVGEEEFLNYQDTPVEVLCNA